MVPEDTRLADLDLRLRTLERASRLPYLRQVDGNLVEVRRADNSDDADVRCKTLTTTSTEDAKEVEGPAPDLSAELAAADVVVYRYLSDEPDGPLHLGVIAEQAPAWIRRGDGVDHGSWLGWLTKNLQDAAARIAALEATVATDTPSV